jgi:type VI secretion system protein ImpA
MKKSKDAIHQQDYLAPLSEAEPCGPNLEYDPEYVALQTRMIPKGDAQYGDFVKVPEAPNWREIERECQRMLLRSRDIPMLLLLLRCRIHLVQTQGLREILEILLGWFERFPEHIHPQILMDGEKDPTVRANALLALTDLEGILGDLRDVTLSKNAAMHLKIRDVERAFATPRSNDALAPDSVRRQLNDLFYASDANTIALVESARLARRLRECLLADMGEDAPDLGVFFHLLDHFYREGSESFAASENLSQEAASESSATTPQPPTSPATMPAFAVSPEKARENALQSIRSVREWFEQYEPSSPVPVLLRQAEHMIGKKFSEVAQEIPFDLLDRWSEHS